MRQQAMKAQKFSGYDTLKAAKRLQGYGLEQKAAEGLAEEFKESADSMLGDLVTKSDLKLAVNELDAKIDKLDAKIERLSLQLTVRLGSLLVVGITALAAIIKFF